MLVLSACVSLDSQRDATRRLGADLAQKERLATYDLSKSRIVEGKEYYLFFTPHSASPEDTTRFIVYKRSAEISADSALILADEYARSRVGPEKYDISRANIHTYPHGYLITIPLSGRPGDSTGISISRKNTIEELSFTNTWMPEIKRQYRPVIAIALLQAEDEAPHSWDLPRGKDELTQRLTYPDIAQKAGVEGLVTLQFTIDEQGYATDIAFTKAIGAGIEEQIEESLDDFQFNLEQSDLEPGAVRMNLSVLFKLEAR